MNDRYSKIVGSLLELAELEKAFPPLKDVGNTVLDLVDLAKFVESHKGRVFVAFCTEDGKEVSGKLRVPSAESPPIRVSDVMTVGVMVTGYNLYIQGFGKAPKLAMYVPFYDPRFAKRGDRVGLDLR